ncbi:MAG TPA: hypothetical protein DIW41_02260 [Lachnospiraceae bacterium]|nr:hypothetical protein [Lachnospiraceae bacterium]
MDYYISKNGKSSGDGSKESPFKTIGQAAKIAKAGDTVIIGGGIYREWVNPANGGDSNDKRITYIAAPGEKPVISGGEEVFGWEMVKEGVWKTTVSNQIFGDYNPFADLLFGEWYAVVDFDKHMGELYLNGHAMYETPTLEALMSTNDTGEKAYKWFAVVSEKTTEIWGRFNEINPNEHCTEVNARKYCFFPEKEGLNYITLSGLIFENAAPQWAPPTAFQEGAVGTHWSKGWVIENCVIRNAKCSGLSLGKHLDQGDNTKEISVEKGGTQF